MPSRISDMEMNETEDSLLKPTVNVVTASATNGDGTTPASRMLGDDIPVGVLETMAERRARKRSHYVVYITTFVMSVGFSIVLTGVWPYLQQLDPSVSKQFLGWVVAASPLGQMLASPLFGIWANKAGSNRGAFFATVFAFIVGNILYATLVLFGSAARAVMIFARFVVGVSSANIAIIRSYVAASTTMNERTTAVSLISASQGLGFIFGPAIQSAFAVAFGQNENYTGNDTETGNVTLTEMTESGDAGLSTWNMYTATGWFAALLGVINICLYLPCIFQEHPVAANEAQFRKHLANSEDGQHLKPDYPVLIVLLLTFFLVLKIFVLVEILLVPMTMDMYAWPDKKAITTIGIALSIAGAVAVIIFGSVGPITKKIDERMVLIFGGLVSLILGALCFFPMGNTYPKIQNCTIDTQITNVKDNRHTLFSNHSFGEDMLIFNNASISNTEEKEFGHIALSRKRRGIFRDDTCLALGCPVIQTWCTYTPITELPQLVIAFFVTVVGYAFSFAILPALFSKVLGLRPQGFWMGILTSTGSFSRVMGPIFVSNAYTFLGPRWTFGILFAALLSAVVMVSFLYKRIVPLNVEKVKSFDS